MIERFRLIRLGFTHFGQKRGLHFFVLLSLYLSLRHSKPFLRPSVAVSPVSSPSVELMEDENRDIEGSPNGEADDVNTSDHAEGNKSRPHTGDGASPG